MTACNRIIAERTQTRSHERHIHALESTKGQVDASQPKDHAHLRSKPKTRKLQEDRAAEIQLENRILLQKMLNIDTKSSELADAMNAGSFKPRSLHGQAQQRELDRITTENQALLHRLQNTKPSIDPRAWEEEEVDRQALKFRLSQNSAAGRVAKLRMPNNAQPQPRGPYNALPRIGEKSARQHEDEWAELTNSQLDLKLRDIERGSPGRGPGSA
eukprot:CAMPEP_0197659342 /NCGR_PEP_ID=MMETSP1338-20131121/47309_1 /TAXON_ID=43686 ORGANISM="Pelagodinium beii, Strain RCC1491" /NCGR_SAMPLE_ID=MMETSP1338 /ASSEMBLY_ACC=CAM_ASM_000754 /LENGTH=214 /DNA_ID=CAMNT_0043236223 /DNA_START=139 /DNA_END=783 /DNA_ORIENTATION=-